MTYVRLSRSCNLRMARAERSGGSMAGPANRTSNIQTEQSDRWELQMVVQSTFSFSRASLTGLVERGTGATGWDSLESAMAIRAESPRVNSKKTQMGGQLDRQGPD